MGASLKIEFMPGDNIETAFEQATKLADKLEIVVEFKFNDVTCFAYPGGIPEKGVEGYHKTLENKEKYLMAFNK